MEFLRDIADNPVIGFLLGGLVINVLSSSLEKRFGIIIVLVLIGGLMISIAGVYLGKMFPDKRISPRL
jgi:hypothetical protein